MTDAPDLARKYRLVYDFSEDVGHENGDYECECAACGRHFLGHKRRVLCRLCSTTPAPEPVCRWSWSSIEGFWCCDCGGSWVFIDGTPADNDCRFCPHCGNRVEVEVVDDE